MEEERDRKRNKKERERLMKKESMKERGGMRETVTWYNTMGDAREGEREKKEC